MGKTPAKGAAEEVAQLHEGELYILRTNSAKGSRECMSVLYLLAVWFLKRLNFARFTTAVATVRRTETPFEYQLVITRAYQEGEAELLDDIDEDEGTRYWSLILRN
jgi:VID27 N-terminal region